MPPEVGGGLDDDLLSAFLADAEEGLAQVEAMLADGDPQSLDADCIQTAFRLIHSLKGNAGFFHLTGTVRLAHAVEDILDQLRNGLRSATRGLIDALLRAVDHQRQMIAALVDGGADDVESAEDAIAALQRAASGDRSEARWERVLRRLRGLAEHYGPLVDGISEEVQGLEIEVLALRPSPEALEEVAPAAVATPPPAERAQTDTGRFRSTDVHRSVRVNEAHIDAFLEGVGELLVVGDLLRHLHDAMVRGDDPARIHGDFRRAVDQFDTLAGRLRRDVLAVRRVPLRGLMRKLPRLIRDTAAQLDKDIVLDIEGEEVEADKRLVDLLDAPLTHLVRNSVDHGIEPQAARAAAGKPPQGRVMVSISEDEGWLQVVISDDGAGLDRDRIRAKAVANGLIAADEQLADEVIDELIFASGLSTAANVSDISGRGVGMDVVRRTVVDAGGTVSVRSRQGEGSAFTIRLPAAVSTQFVRAMAVEAGGQPFLLPLEMIGATYERSRCRIDGVLGARGQVVQIQGRSLCLSSLAALLGLPPGDEAVIVEITGDDQQTRALACEQVLAVRQAVLRPLDGMHCHPAVRGATLMGDGRVALVLSPADLWAL